MVKSIIEFTITQSLCLDADRPAIANRDSPWGYWPGDSYGEPGRIGPIYRRTRYFLYKPYRLTGPTRKTMSYTTRNIRALTLVIHLLTNLWWRNCDVFNLLWLIKSYFRLPVDSWIYVVCVINVGFIYMVKASRLNAIKASKSKALAAIASGLGKFTS